MRLPCRIKAILLMILWAQQQQQVGAAQSTSLRGLSSGTTTTNNSSSSSSSSTAGKGRLNKVYSNLKFSRSTSSSNNGIPNYAAIPKFQVFFGSQQQPYPSNSKSNTHRISPRIVGGSNANPNMSSFYAMHLTYNATTAAWHFAGCGATLISNCHVLTAAHCVSGNRKGILQGVYVNAYAPFIGNAGKPYFFSTPQTVTVHPQFNAATDVHDIAIVRMQQCLDITKFVPAVVASPALTMVKGNPVTTMGFGRLSSSSTTQVDTLQAVNLTYYDANSCNAFYKPYGNTVSSDMMCAGVSNGGKDACQGDSGGPLLFKDKTLIGVVSWGRGCALANFPGVYNSVAAHYAWIQNLVCDDPYVSSTLQVCIDFASRVSATLPAPPRSPLPPSPVAPKPATAPSKPAYCSQNINGSFSYTTSAGVTITLACVRMLPGQVGHRVCSQPGAIRTCPRACNPSCS